MDRTGSSGDMFRPMTSASVAPSMKHQTSSDQLISSMESQVQQYHTNQKEKNTNMIAKQQTKLLVHLQRTLNTQRSAIEKLRAENEVLRENSRSATFQKMGGGGNDGVSHVLGATGLITQKMKVDEEIRACLDTLEAQRHKMKEVAAEIKEKSEKAFGGKGGKRHMSDREKNKYVNRLELRLQKAVTGFNETLNYNKERRREIDELRHDALNVKKRYEGRDEKLEAYNQVICQLVHVANEFFRERANVRLVASQLITQAGTEAAEHRSSIAELSNRSEYFDQLMKEREEDFKKELQSAERQTKNLDNNVEEQKEADRKRQQQLIAVFDHLMHVFGVWDVNELIERFLAKEEKAFVQYRYLDALNADAQHVQERMAQINAQAEALLKTDPVDDDEVVRLKEGIIEAEERSTEYEQHTHEASELLGDITRVLARINQKTKKSKLLADLRPARRRWALIRANLKLIKNFSSKKDVPLHSSKRPPIVLTGAGVQAGAAYDPRRKTLEEDLEGLDEDLGHVASVAITELGVLERATLRLISAERLMERRTRKRRAVALKIDQNLIIKALNFARTGVRNVGVVKASLLGGPKFPVQKEGGRAEMLVMPSLKDIDSPRSADGAMSPREIVETVREEGFSEKVAEKFKKMLIQRMPLHADKFKPKGMTVGDMTLQALRNAKQAEAEVSNMARGGGHSRGKKSASDSRKKDELRDSSLQRSGTSEPGGGLPGGNNKLKAINRRKSTIHGGVADMSSVQPGKEVSRRTSSHDSTTPSKLHSESHHKTRSIPSPRSDSKLKPLAVHETSSSLKGGLRSPVSSLGAKSVARQALPGPPAVGEI